jgi:hypothetical protein
VMGKRVSIWARPSGIQPIWPPRSHHMKRKPSVILQSIMSKKGYKNLVKAYYELG